MGRSVNGEKFSARRLNGEPVPNDVKILLGHTEELVARSGIKLSCEAEWTPWLDTSYLTEADRSNPDIIANMRAIADVCRLISFIAAHEDGEYYGYWQGPSMRPVNNAPLVLLDNEGQFRLCGSTFTEAVLSRTYDEEEFSEMRDWLRSLNIESLPETLSAVASPQVETAPHELHNSLYYRYLGLGPD